MTQDKITRYHSGPRSFATIEEAIGHAESRDFPEISICVDGVITSTHQMRPDSALGHGGECGLCGGSRVVPSGNSIGTVACPEC